jgi:clan AA aspartic protease
MGLTYADIELINADDVALARKHIVGQEEIKRVHVNMLVDCGALNLCINESIQAQLQLLFLERRIAELANGNREAYDLVGPVVVKFKNRQTVCNALVLQGNNEPLFGAIPMEDMDVLIHPARQELIVNPEHPYLAQMKLK